MDTGTSKLFRDRSKGSQQAGQALVIVALSAIVLMAMAGLAVDSGRAYLNKRSLQAAADSASDAAMRMLLRDLHDQIGGTQLTFTDCDIATKVGDIANANSTSASGSGIDSSIVQYIDAFGNPASVGAPNGTSTPQCGATSAGTSLNLCVTLPAIGCVAGVAHTPQYAQGTYLLNVVGNAGGVQQATATSAFTYAPAVSGVGPWFIYDQDCRPYQNARTNTLTKDSDLPGPSSPLPTSDSDGIQGESSPGANDGDIVRFKDNQWGKPGNFPTNCGDGTQTFSSSFKGFIDTWPNYVTYPLDPAPPAGTPSCHDNYGAPLGTFTAIRLGDCLGNSGGNHSEPSPLTVAPSGVLILPVIDTIDGTGGDYRAHISQFAAARWLSTAWPPPSGVASAQIIFLCDPSTVDAMHCVIPPGWTAINSGFLK